MTIKVDRRVVKTKRAIRTAFETLATTHRYRDITVKDLADEADINRKTFYLHYDSIDDLVESYVADTTETLVELIHRRPFKESYQHPELMLNDFVKLLQAHRKFIVSLLLADEYSFFGREIEHNVTQELTKTIRAEFPLSATDAALCATFTIHNPLSLFRYYVNGDVTPNHREFQHRILRLTATGLSSFFAPFSPTPVIPKED